MLNLLEGGENMMVKITQKQKGFTLVELVIVIALLAALALGILAALDPLEQLRKGQDTSKRDTATQYYTAAVRYFAAREYMPWCVDAANCPPLGTQAISSATYTTAKLVEFGELKESFSEVNSTKLTQIFVTGADNAITVCYKPQSKQFRADPLTRYTDDAGTSPTCVNGPSVEICYWCAK